MRPPPYSDGSAAEMLQEGSKFLQVPFVTTSKGAKICWLIANGSHWGVTSPQNQQPCGLCHDPGQFEGQVVTSRSCLTTVVLKISPTASPWSKWETAACMHPYCLPAACHILPEPMLVSDSHGAQVCRHMAGFPQQGARGCCKDMGSKWERGDSCDSSRPCWCRGRAQAPWNSILGSIQTALCDPWVVCAGEPALRGQF